MLTAVNCSRGALNHTGTEPPTVSSRDLPPAVGLATRMTPKSYWLHAPPTSASASFGHCGEVMASTTPHSPKGSACAWVPVLPLLTAPELLNAGAKVMLVWNVPPLPPCRQWLAVHTRLLLPGCAGSETTVPEQT